MIIDARTIESDATLHADVCIVGGGPAGISLAMALADAALDVIVLESGGVEPDPETQALSAGEREGAPYYDLDATVVRAFGGATAVWGGWLHPLEPLDLSHRPWVPHSGWPIKAEDLAPYWQGANRICEAGSCNYDVRLAEEALSTKAISAERYGLRTKLLQHSPPTRFGSKYRGAFKGPTTPNLTEYATVTKLETVAENAAVQRLEARTREGNRFFVRGRAYVLAAGGIENARLLLDSTDVSEHGLANDGDCVGRYFMEHPHVLGGKIIPRQTTSFGILYNSRIETARGVTTAILALSDDVQQKEELLNLTVEPVRIWRVDPSAEKEDPMPFVFYTRAEQAPNPDNRVVLSNERNALGCRRPKLVWRLSNGEIESIVRSHNLIGQAIHAAGLGSFQPEIDPVSTPYCPSRSMDAWYTRQIHGAAHHMGTTRMHQDPRRGVVDSNCRAHGVPNLYIAGSSVFPTSGFANPTLTLIALALRLADHLKTELGKTSS